MTYEGSAWAFGVRPLELVLSPESLFLPVLYFSPYQKSDSHLCLSAIVSVQTFIKQVHETVSGASQQFFLIPVLILSSPCPTLQQPPLPRLPLWLEFMACHVVFALPSTPVIVRSSRPWQSPGCNSHFSAWFPSRSFLLSSANPQCLPLYKK